MSIARRDEQRNAPGQKFHGVSSGLGLQLGEPLHGNLEEGGIAASIIITSQDRRTYLLDSVRSVLNQDVDRSTYELIVVKNFQDERIDSFLDDVGARRLLCSDPSASRKIVEGLGACRGSLVLLLDDDDLFEPNKLRIVLSAFDSYHRLGFYHNHFSYIGPDGDPLDKKRIRSFGLRLLSRARRVYLKAGAQAEELIRLAYTYPDFNSSSIAIRRDLAVSTLPYLLQIDGPTDTFFFFAALVSSYSLLIDDASLTRYRVHDENISLAGGPDPGTRRARLLDFAQKQHHVYNVIREMVAGSGSATVLKQIDARVLINRLSIMYRDPQSRRLDAVRTLIEGVRLWRTYPIRENVPSVAGALLLAITPQLARRAYEHQMLIR